MDNYAAEQYHRAKLAMLTGWTLEYIDGLGAVDASIVLEVYEAEQALRTK
jgi:hypothetical protein